MKTRIFPAASHWLCGVVCFAALAGIVRPAFAQTATDDKPATAESNVENDGENAKASQELTSERLYQMDHMVDIQIDIAPELWDEIRVISRDFVEALSKDPPKSPFEYVKADITIDGVVVKDIGIRKKGFIGSLDSTRPSLKISFDEFVDQDPIPGVDRLTLNNNKQDPSRYCQFLSYKLFRDSGTVASRCNFAKVIVNGNYLGIYSNVESVRKQMLENGFSDGSGALWEGTVTDFFPKWYKRFEKKNKKAKFKPLKKLTEILAEDELDMEALSERVDIDAFVRFWVMESLIGFWDGYCSNQNNFFIYRNPADKKIYFVPWGTDASFSKTTPLPPYRIRPMSVHSKSVLCNKLYRVPAVKKQYEETMMKFLDEHWNEDNLLAEIDRLEKFLEPEIHEHNTRFKATSKKTREFVSWRRKALMREFKKGPPELKSRERTPIYFDQVGVATITFNAEWFERTPRETGGLGDVEIDFKMGEDSVEFSEIGAYCERSKWPSEESIKPASIVITGKRKSDGKQITFGLGVDNNLFQPTGDDEVEIGGIFMLNNAFVDSKGRMQMIGGTVQLKEASTEEGKPTSGSMQLSIMTMKGGDEYESDADKQQEVEEKAEKAGDEAKQENDQMEKRQGRWWTGIEGLAFFQQNQSQNSVVHPNCN